MNLEAGKRDILRKNNLGLNEGTSGSPSSSKLKSAKGFLPPKVLSGMLGCVAKTCGASLLVYAKDRHTILTEIWDYGIHGRSVRRSSSI